MTSFLVVVLFESLQATRQSVDISATMNVLNIIFSLLNLTYLH